MRLLKKIIFGLSIPLLLAVMLLSNYVYSEIKYKNALNSAVNLAIANGVVLEKDLNLSIEDIESAIKTQKAYSGYQYTNITLTAELKYNNKNINAKTAFITDDIIKNNKLWTATVGQDLELDTPSNTDGTVPIVVGGRKFKKVNIGEIIDFNIKGQNGADLMVKGKVIGKIDDKSNNKDDSKLSFNKITATFFGLSSSNLSVPEYEDTTIDDYKTIVDATIYLKDSKVFSDLFVNRDKKIITYNDVKASKESVESYKKKLHTLGAVSSIDSSLIRQYALSQSSAIGNSFYSKLSLIIIALIICASVVMCILSNICILKNGILKIIVPLCGFVIAIVGSIMFCPIFAQKATLSEIVKGNLLVLLTPLFIICINAIYHIVKLLRSRTMTKTTKEVIYEKI